MATSRALAVRAPRRVVRRTVSVVRRGIRRRTKATLPLGIVAGFLPLIFSPDGLVAGYRVDGFNGFSNRLPGILGVETNGEFVGWSVMKRRGVPAIAIGFAAHWLAGKTGLNRALGRAKIPY